MRRRKFAKNLGLGFVSIQYLPQFFSLLENKEQNFLIGKSKSSRFQKIDNQFLEKKTAKQFVKLQEAAFNDGVDIQIASAFRSFNRQKQIFESKLKALQKENITTLNAIHQIINYSSIPGTSRHHWGTEIDIIEKKESNIHVNDLLSEKHFNEEGRFNNLHKWMTKNAAEFGFYLTYTNDAERTGYLYEPWHYSYLPSSKKYLESYIELNIPKIIKKEKVIGFDVLDEVFFNDYITNYVLGINTILK